jgi:hypothetical protein
VDAWQDFSAQVIWKDVDNMNLARVADAYGKLATMLGVPAKFLWEKIPGWTMQDVERARQMSEDEDSVSRLTDVLTSQMGTPAGEPADVKTKADALGALIRAGVEPEDAAREVGLTDVDFTGAVPVSLRLPEAQASGLEG